MLALWEAWAPARRQKPNPVGRQRSMRQARQTA
jgi:hypothetical protein